MRFATNTHRYDIEEVKKKILLNKMHIFPACVVFVFVLLTALSINGSSIGLLYQNFSPPNSPKDPSHIAWTNQSIRGDEWGVLTPKSISQADNNFEVINKNIGFGEDTAVLIDAPVKDWSILFSPQNLGFFFMPLNNALAFKWWFMFGAVIISCYYFVLRFFAKSIPGAISLSFFVAFAPLIQWTFRNFLLTPIAAGLVSVILADSVRRGHLRKKVLHILLLTYSLLVFALVIYPPFQVSAAFVLGVFYVFYATDVTKDLKSFFKSQAGVAIAMFAVLIVGSIFYFQHRPALRAISSSEHPGVRRYETGQIDFLPEIADLWTSGTTRLLSKSGNPQHSRYMLMTQNGNQSEAASSVWFVPPLLVMTTLLLLEKRKRKEGTGIVWGVFILQLSLLLYLFIPGLNIPIINQVQPNRSSLMILLIGFLSMGVIAKYAPKDSRYYYEKRSFNLIALTGWVAHLVIMAIAFYYIVVNFPSLIGGAAVATALIVVAFCALAFVKNKSTYALVAISILTLLTTFNVNPLRKGVDSVKSIPLVSRIGSINKTEPGGWFFDGSVDLSSIALLSDVQSITVNQTYEQDYWKLIDPNGKDDFIYSRSAHVVGDISKQTSLELPLVNRIKVNLNPCEQSAVTSLNIRYVVSVHNKGFSDYVSPCMVQIEQVPTGGYDMVTIYKVVPEGD